MRPTLWSERIPDDDKDCECQDWDYNVWWWATKGSGTKMGRLSDHQPQQNLDLELVHLILMMGMKLVPETSTFNQMTWLIAQEDFINW